MSLCWPCIASPHTKYLANTSSQRDSYWAHSIARIPALQSASFLSLAVASLSRECGSNSVVEGKMSS